MQVRVRRQRCNKKKLQSEKLKRLDRSVFQKKIGNNKEKCKWTYKESLNVVNTSKDFWLFFKSSFFGKKS